MARNGADKVRWHRVTEHWLRQRHDSNVKAGYSNMAKWIEFCFVLLEKGYCVWVTESLSTKSKYVYIAETVRGNRYKVRFSDHRPNKWAEQQNDCDFYVGIGHRGTNTTLGAIRSVDLFFKGVSK